MWNMPDVVLPRLHPSPDDLFQDLRQSRRFRRFRKWRHNIAQINELVNII